VNGPCEARFIVQKMKIDHTVQIGNSRRRDSGRPSHLGAKQPVSLWTRVLAQLLVSFVLASGAGHASAISRPKPSSTRRRAANTTSQFSNTAGKLTRNKRSELRIGERERSPLVALAGGNPVRAREACPNLRPEKELLMIWRRPSRPRQIPGLGVNLNSAAKSRCRVPLYETIFWRDRAAGDALVLP
jgi:hypothetical protein